MKRIFKAVLRSAWRATGPIRRPLVNRTYSLLVRASSEAFTRSFAEHFSNSLAEARSGALADVLVHSGLAAELRADAAAAYDRVVPPIHHRLDAAAAAARSTSADLDLLLNGMVREVARLQMQVEALQEAVEAASGPPTSLPWTAESVRGHKFAG